MGNTEGNYYVEFIHSEMSDQQVCGMYFDAESREQAMNYINGLDYVGLVIYLDTTEGMREKLKGGKFVSKSVATKNLL